MRSAVCDLGSVLAAVAAVASVTPAPRVGAAGQARLQVRPPAATAAAAPEPGERRLGLAEGRDATLFVPRRAASNAALPLMVMLHGAGGSARGAAALFPLAEELGVVILAPESRGITWDAIGGAFGPDVVFLDRALRAAFQKIRVDTKRLAIGGFSDGASYALSLGLANGDLFTHVIAFSPGFITPAEAVGRLSIFISHGTQDQVLPINRTSRRIVPRLRDDNYRVVYREFDGPHRVPEPVAREALGWLAR